MARARTPVAAIIGAETLLGRELRDLLSERKPAPAVRMLSGEAGHAKITIAEAEAEVLGPIDRDSLTGLDVMFLAGTSEAARLAMEMAGPAGPPMIDLTGALEDHPRARLRAPGLKSDDGRPIETIDVIVHPAAYALSLLLHRVRSRFALVRCIAEVFEPASERGQAGLTELQKQCVNLFAFKPLPKEVFDAQAGFNMLARYGPESTHNLEEIEARIDRHLASLLLPANIPVPSLRLIHAPVFHGYSFSVWIEFQQDPGVESLEEAIASSDIEVLRAAEDPPNNVGAAGEGALQVGGVRQDRNQPRSYWLWMTSDNLRSSARLAAQVAEEYL